MLPKPPFTVRPIRFRPVLERLDVRCLPSATPDPIPPAVTEPPAVTVEMIVPAVSVLPPSGATQLHYDGVLTTVSSDLADGRTGTVDWGDGTTTPAAFVNGTDSKTEVHSDRTLTAGTTYHVTIRLTRDDAPSDLLLVHVNVTVQGNGTQVWADADSLSIGATAAYLSSSRPSVPAAGDSAWRVIVGISQYAYDATSLRVTTVTLDDSQIFYVVTPAASVTVADSVGPASHSPIPLDGQSAAITPPAADPSATSTLTPFAAPSAVNNRGDLPATPATETGLAAAVEQVRSPAAPGVAPAKAQEPADRRGGGAGQSANSPPVPTVGHVAEPNAPAASKSEERTTIRPNADAVTPPRAGEPLRHQGAGQAPTDTVGPSRYDRDGKPDDRTATIAPLGDRPPAERERERERDRPTPVPSRRPSAPVVRQTADVTPSPSVSRLQHAPQTDPVADLLAELAAAPVPAAAFMEPAPTKKEEEPTDSPRGRYWKRVGLLAGLLAVAAVARRYTARTVARPARVRLPLRTAWTPVRKPRPLPVGPMFLLEDEFDQCPMEPAPAGGVR